MSWVIHVICPVCKSWFKSRAKTEEDYQECLSDLSDFRDRHFLLCDYSFSYEDTKAIEDPEDDYI